MLCYDLYINNIIVIYQNIKIFYKKFSERHFWPLLNFPQINFFQQHLTLFQLIQVFIIAGENQLTLLNHYLPHLQTIMPWVW